MRARIVYVGKEDSLIALATTILQWRNPSIGMEPLPGSPPALLVTIYGDDPNTFRNVHSAALCIGLQVEGADIPNGW